MPKTITYDTLVLEGANVWVGLATQEVRMEAHYSLSSAAAVELIVRKNQEVQDLLSQADRDAILGITTRLKQALEAQELV